MKALLEKMKKRWILIWLIIAAFAAGAFVVFADYTGVNSVKRVVTTQSSKKGEMFSSNSLKSTYSSQRLSSEAYTVTVCNYEQNSLTGANHEQIIYNITADLVVLIGSDFVKVSELTETNIATYPEPEQQRIRTLLELLADRSYKISYTQNGTTTEVLLNSGTSCTQFTLEGVTMPADVRTTDSYKITFDSAELADSTPDFYVFMEVDPQAPSSLQRLEYKLGNRLCTAKSDVDTAAWKGELKEKDDCNNVDYDFYNYVISGSGAGTIDIMWDPTMFEVNEFFFSELAGNTFVTNGGNIITDHPTRKASDNTTPWKKATLEVNSANTEKKRYELQLYKVQGALAYTGDNSAKNYIACSYTENGGS